jgi:hypothetical protein
VVSPGGPPEDATARCRDGSYSFSLHRSGRCSSVALCCGREVGRNDREKEPGYHWRSPVETVMMRLKTRS